MRENLTTCSNTAVPLLFIRTILDRFLCRHEKLSSRYSVNIASNMSTTHEGRHAGGLTDYYNRGCISQLIYFHRETENVNFSAKYQCYSDMSFSIPKTLVIWASLYYLSNLVG